MIIDRSIVSNKEVHIEPNTTTCFLFCVGCDTVYSPNKFNRVRPNAVVKKR